MIGIEAQRRERRFAFAAIERTHGPVHFGQRDARLQHGVGLQVRLGLEDAGHRPGGGEEPRARRNPVNLLDGAQEAGVGVVGGIQRGAAHVRPDGQAHGAVAVDMESSAVAEVAAASHVPFMAIRVIVDSALDAIPASVTAAGETGQIRIGRLLLGVARSPGDIVALVNLARRYRAAMGSLRAVGKLGRLAPAAMPAENRR